MNGITASSSLSYWWGKKYKNIFKKHRTSLYSSQDHVRGFLRNFVLFSIIIIFVLLLCIFFLQKTFFSDENTIQNISFSSESFATYNDPYVYVDFKNMLQWMNYYYFSIRWKNSVVSAMQEKYPFIDTIDVVSMHGGVIKIHVSFAVPDLVMQNNSHTRGVYNDVVFPIFSWNTIGSGERVLYLASYLTGTYTLSGLFFPLSTQLIADQFHTIWNTLPDIEKIVYIAWGEKMAILLNSWKRLFVNNRKDIVQQLAKFSIFQEHAASLGTWLSYDDIGQIDLGSLDYIIIKTW